MCMRSYRYVQRNDLRSFRKTGVTSHFVDNVEKRQAGQSRCFRREIRIFPPERNDVCVRVQCIGKSIHVPDR